MKTDKMKWFGKAAGAGVLALTLAAPALQAQSFGDHQRGNDQNQPRASRGDSRGQGQYNRGQNGGQYDRGQSGGQYDRGRNDVQYNRNEANRDGNGYRENQRINVQGRVTSFSRERNGYRVQLDRGRDSYWVPESNFRGHNLRAGISVVLGGVFRGGAINIDAVNWPDGGYGYGPAAARGYVAGVVERVDYRDGTMMLRDGDGRMITAATGRYGIGNIRPGDYVELSGDWAGGGLFRVDHIDNVRTRR